MTNFTSDALARIGGAIGTRSFFFASSTKAVEIFEPKKLLWGLLFTVLSSTAMAQNADFNVTVNTGAVPPNGGTVFPGEATSLRITLSNNSTASALTNVSYSKALPTTALNGLLINGASVITGDPGCTLGTLTTTPGQADVTLSGLTVPARQVGVPGTGECYLDLPIVAFSTDGNSTSLSYSLNAGEVSSNEGANATGGPQAITIRATQRPSWAKTVLPNDTLVVGGAVRTMRITLANNDNTVDLTNISFTDIFPTSGGIAIAEPTGTPATSNCSGANVALTTGNFAQVAVTGANIPAGASCIVEVEIRGLQTNGSFQRNINNVIQTSSYSSDQGLQPSANAVRRFLVRSPLAVNKSFNPGVITSGQENSFRITLTNNGNAPLTVVNFPDNPIGAPRPDLMLIGSTADISNNCGGSSALESGGQGFSVSGFVIPANSNCLIDVNYTAFTPGADQPFTFTNAIGAGDVATNVPGVVSQNRTATVLVADRLRVLKSGSPNGAAPGDPVRYDIIVQNFSAAAITDVSVTDTLANGSTLLLAGFTPTLTPACGALDLNGASQGDGSVTFTIPTLPGRSGINSPGVCTISFSAMIDPNATTNTSNQIGSGGVCFGAGPTCNTVPSQNVNTVRREPISLNKTFNGGENATASEGTPVRLRIQINNNAISALTNLSFSDTFPTAGPFQQMRVATPPNVSNTCGGTVTAVADATSISLNTGTVPGFNGSVAGACALELDVVGPAGVYPNSADASAIRSNADGTTTTLIGSDTATATFTDTLAAEKIFSPDETGPNGSSTASIRLTNLDPVRPITGISFTDNLPANMVVADPPNAYTTCSGATTLDVSAGSSSASLDGATLSPLAVCELIFDVSVTGNTDWINTIPAGGITADGGLNNRAPVSATLRFVAPDVPLISKSITPGIIVPGESATLTISLTNGSQALTNMMVTDYFTDDGLVAGTANGMRIADDPQLSTSCTNGIVTAAPGSDSVRLSGASIASGAQCEITVQVTSTTVGTLTNTIPMNTIESDQGATNTTTFAQSTLSTTSEVGVSKNFEPPVVSPNQPARLRITIFNAQAEALTGLSLQDDFPAGLVIAAEPLPFSDCGGGVSITFPTNASVRLDGGSIGAASGAEAASCVLEVDVLSTSEGTFINTIPEDSLTANGNPVPHPPGEGRLEVRERLIVNKAFDNRTLDMDDPVGFMTGVVVELPGTIVPMTIRVENPNSIELTKVNFIDVLPDGLVLSTTPDVSTTCTDGSVTGVSSGREVRLAGATLAAAGNPGAICTVTANVVSNIPGIYTNEIPAGDVKSFEGVDNDPGTQAQIIIANRPGVSKEFNPPVVAPLVPTTLRIVIENENFISYALTAPLIDNLPADPGQVTVATPSVFSTTCPGGNSIVTAVAGANSVQIATGAAIPAGGCEVNVDVIAPIAGEYLNNIPVGALTTVFGVNEEPADGPLKSSTLGYISGRVFLDRQAVPNGIYLPGNSIPIDGNPIELRSGANCSGGVLETVDTDANGSYLFDDLPAGIYSVCQPVQPDDTLNSVTVPGTIIPVAGSTGTVGSASNPGGGTPTSQIINIVLQNNGNADEVSGSPGNDFSEVQPASIAGNVWYDENNDGVFDNDESGIGGVTINLTGPVNTSTVTAADGSYSFTDLPPGIYTVIESQPGAFTDGMDSLGNVFGTPRGDASINDQFSSINLAPNENGVQYDFGEVLDSSSIALNANAFCLNDAVRISYDLPDFSGGGAGDPPPITLRLITTDDRLVQVLNNQSASGQILWPGAEVDMNDMGVAWPGWVAIGNAFAQVADDRIPRLILEADLGGGVQVQLNYPQSNNNCLTQPPGTGERPAIPTLPFSLIWVLALLSGGLGLRKLRQM